MLLDTNGHTCMYSFTHVNLYTDMTCRECDKSIFNILSRGLIYTVSYILLSGVNKDNFFMTKATQKNR